MILKNLKQYKISLRQSILIWQGSRMFMRAVAEAERLHAEDGHRYYVIFNPSTRQLFPVTYELHHKEGSFKEYRRTHPHATFRDYMCSAHANSYKSLVWRGRFRNRLSLADFREMSFYFTASRNGAASISNTVIARRKDEWLHYYVRIMTRCTNIRHVRRKISLRTLPHRIYLWLKTLIDKVIKSFY